MNPTPMCKTAIISFIIDEILLKLWTLSSNMRKRVQMILAGREIAATEYNPNLFELIGWTNVEDWNQDIEDLEDIQKGVSNCKIESQEQFDEQLLPDKTINCEGFNDSLPSKPFSFDRIEGIYIYEEKDLEFYLKCNLNTIKQLTLGCLEPTDKIQLLFDKIRKINNLMCTQIDLPSLDLSKIKIESAHFHRINFEKKLLLPKNMEKVSFESSDNLHHLNIQNVETVSLYHKEGIAYEDVLSLQGAKRIGELSISDSDRGLMVWEKVLPSTMRVFLAKITWDLCQYTKEYDCLIQFGYLTITSELAKKLDLTDIEPKTTSKGGKSIPRPRKISLTKKNIVELTEEPDLFKRIKMIYVSKSDFDFDCLIEDTEETIVFNPVNIESKGLNRL